MQTKIHEPTQIVEVMLTHAEQADEAVKKQLKELYAQYKGTKYTVVIRLKQNQTIVELAQGIPKLFRVALVCNHKDLVPCHTGQLVLQPDR